MEEKDLFRLHSIWFSLFRYIKQNDGRIDDNSLDRHYAEQCELFAVQEMEQQWSDISDRCAAERIGIATQLEQDLAQFRNMIRRSMAGVRGSASRIGSGGDADYRLARQVLDDLESDDDDDVVMEEDDEVDEDDEDDRGIYVPYECAVSGGEFHEHHRIQGINWMLKNWYSRRNCALVGDTMPDHAIQTAVFLQQLRERHGVSGPHLVVVPIEEMGRWNREIKKRIPDARILVKDDSYSPLSDSGSVDLAMDIEDDVSPVLTFEEFNRVKRREYDVVLLSGQQLRTEMERFQQHRIYWHTLVVDDHDESLLLNGHTDTHYRVLFLQNLSPNTPIEEMRRLLHLLQHQEGVEHQSLGIGDDQVQQIYQVLSTYVHRCSSLRITEYIVLLEATIIQKMLIQAVLEMHKPLIISKPAHLQSLRGLFAVLERSCTHPFLVSAKSAEVFHLVKSVSSIDDKKNFFINCSTKFVFLYKFLDKIAKSQQKQQEKTVVVSQCTETLDLVETFLKDMHNLRYVRINYRTMKSEQQQQECMKSFNSQENDIRVLLLRHQAEDGHIGSCAAKHVVLLDTGSFPFNIDQTRDVSVYRLIMKNTHEQVRFSKA